MGGRAGDGGVAGRVLGAGVGQDESLKPSLSLLERQLPGWSACFPCAHLCSFSRSSQAGRS